MQYSIIIPIRNEQQGIIKTLEDLTSEIKNYNYEILLINDFSTDETSETIKKNLFKFKSIRLLNNKIKGLGRAISFGIQESKGEYVCIMMSDLSDDINDLKKYFELIALNDVDAIFGSRFTKESKVKNYPKNKLILNRIANLFVKYIFFNNYNDFTNAFKIYRRNSLLKTLPLVSESFNIFLEIPLKFITRKMKYRIIPINWNGRISGKSKFEIKELRSKYLFTLFYCLLEKVLLKK
tara:strand:- start:54 stop:764 length:711 start_codon:yes stop_codon:yes gene_type:complete